MNLDSVWRLFGSVYREAMKAAAQQSHMELQTGCVKLIGILREKSGLAPAQSLRLVVAFRDALNTVIDHAKIS
jgi:hypothetical protein